MLIAAGCKSTEALSPDQTAASVDISPRSARMWVVGDSVHFSVSVVTNAGTDGSALPVVWVSRNPSLLSMSATGEARTLMKGDSTYVVATVGGKSDSVFVEVPMTPCGGVTRTSMAIGQVVTDIGANGFCAASTLGAGYVVFAFFNSLTSSSNVTFQLTGLGLALPAAAASHSLATFMRPTGLSLATARRRNVRGELAFRDSEHTELSPRVAAAQAWYASRSHAALRAAAPVPAVGDLMTVNTNMSTNCSAPRINHTARVAAVSKGAIILSDSTNPAGGFSDTAYARIATTFDTLVSPVDTTTFGAPTDLDKNGHVIILFTRAINELTPSGSLTYIGGRTMSRDLFPTTALQGTSPFVGKSGCDASNVGEVFYILAPDPNGLVNGNHFTRGFVDTVAVATIAHEYQHLINYSRRMYLIPGLAASQWADEIWLHEGLSHMAEELVYHRSSGLPTRANLDLTELAATDSLVDIFNEFMVGDFFNYDSYASGVATTSPFHQSDDLATRGATWSFLRYAADRLGPTDGTGTSNLFYKLVNSGQIGLTNLETQLGVTAAGIQAMIRDFTISVYADDWVDGVDPKYTQPSWNMRAIYPGFGDPTFVYPLRAGLLTENTPAAIALNAGGFAVFQFTALDGTDAFIRAKGQGGITLPTSITLSVIRIR